MTRIEEIESRVNAEDGYVTRSFRESYIDTGLYTADLTYLLAEVKCMREALEWYAADDGGKFYITDEKGVRITQFASFTSRARAALKGTQS